MDSVRDRTSINIITCQLKILTFEQKRIHSKIFLIFLQWLEEPTAIPCINNKIHFKLLVNKWQLKWKKKKKKRNANLNPQRAKTSTSYISKIFTVRSWKGLDRISNPVLGDSSYEKHDSSVTNGSLKSRKIIMSIQTEQEKTRWSVGDFKNN